MGWLFATSYYPNLTAHPHASLYLSRAAEEPINRSESISAPLEGIIQETAKQRRLLVLSRAGIQVL